MLIAFGQGLCQSGFKHQELANTAWAFAKCGLLRPQLDKTVGFVSLLGSAQCPFSFFILFRFRLHQLSEWLLWSPGAPSSVLVLILFIH